MAASMQRLTFGTAGDTGNLRCVNDHAHRVMVIRANDQLYGWCHECFDFGAPLPDVIASLAWYDDHENLSTLVDWLGDMAPSEFRSVVEKPWKWETEYKAAVASRAHEMTHDGHEVLHDGTSDTDAYCDFEGCDWRCVDGVANDVALAVSS